MLEKFNLFIQENYKKKEVNIIEFAEHFELEIITFDDEFYSENGNEDLEERISIFKDTEGKWFKLTEMKSDMFFEGWKYHIPFMEQVRPVEKTIIVYEKV